MLAYYTCAQLQYAFMEPTCPGYMSKYSRDVEKSLSYMLHTFHLHVLNKNLWVQNLQMTTSLGGIVQCRLIK